MAKISILLAKASRSMSNAPEQKIFLIRVFRYEVHSKNKGYEKK